MDHPLHDPPTEDDDDDPATSNPPLTPSSKSQRSNASYSTGQKEDWHQYTLHSAPATPASLSSSSSQNTTTATRQQRYESLTGLLHQSGTSPAFGVEADDESYKHMNMEDYNGSQCMDENEAANRRRKNGRCKLFGCYVRYDSPCAILLGLVGIGVLGVILGFTFPTTTPSSSSPTGEEEDDESAADAIAKWDIASNILGYAYFLSWTLSFYPQIITNWKHPSEARHGVSLDFVVWNIVGFGCYAVYTTSFRYSDAVRKEYAERFGGDDYDYDAAAAAADGSGGGDLGNNVTSSVMGVFLSDTPGYASRRDGPDYIIDTSNPFGWIWGDDNSTDNGGSNSTNNSTNSEDTTNTDAVAVPQVKGNDVAFAWHALLLTIITFVQIVHCSGRSKRDDIDEGWIEVERAEDDDAMVRDHGYSNSLGIGEEDDFVGSPNSQEYALEQRMETDDFVDYSQPGHLLPQPMNQNNIHWLRRISSTTKCLILLLLLVCIAGAVMVACNVNISYWGGGDHWQWIDYLYFLSFVKVGVSIVKYIPQVALNYRRKSTSGWQIWNIILDFSGGSLSIVQLVGDSLAEAKAQGLPHSWTGIIGNPAKFGLGLVSIFFDIIFMFQHYVLYRHPSSRQVQNESDEVPTSDYETPLLCDQ